MAIDDHYPALEPVVTIFRDTGLYAYRTLTDENDWAVAVDLEDGRVDVRIGDDGYLVEVSAISTGMFMDEEDDRRRRVLERLARISMPGIRRGMLAEHQDVDWDVEGEGIALRSQHMLPFSGAVRIPTFALNELQELNIQLRIVERQIVE